MEGGRSEGQGKGHRLGTGVLRQGVRVNFTELGNNFNSVHNFDIQIYMSLKDYKRKEETISSEIVRLHLDP